ncbi:MAG: sulfatase-like hydrolase/transferase [Planctomycetota bacterium]|nr:MAG: sulfatase-like hydrolase/transferase [Planctomycetota bacterium]
MRISRRDFIKSVGVGAAAVTIPGCGDVGRMLSVRPVEYRPNFVVIFCDDVGYADVGCFGAKGWETPNLDRMAAEGMRFTSFYVAAPSCTPSRAALLTGCYPQRVGLPYVLFPEGPSWTEDKTKIGISSKEETVAELLKEKGYATACIGKWHLGHHRKFLPTRHGFDYYFGLPYSNDMRPENNEHYPPLPLVEGEEAIEYDPDQSQLVRRYTEKAVEFIRRNKDRPFFVYVPHTMAHVPLYVSERFGGKSEQGMYGDVMMELDWSAGEILSAIKEAGVDEKTLVIFTSDNGPWLSYGDHGGLAGPLREGKGTTWEGGMREPCIMRWPGQIPAGLVCGEMATAMDILPTFARLSGARMPRRKIDGQDIWALMAGEKMEHKPFYYYRHSELQAVRCGRWKLHVPHRYRTLAGRSGGTGGKGAKYEQAEIGVALYDLEVDVGEKYDVAAENPEVVERMMKLIEKMRKGLGDSITGVEGAKRREPGKL